MTPSADFASRLLYWYDRQGRKNLPWQQDRTPYRVWVSEIMLQQTQVTTVIDYYQRFMQHFPDFPSLAAASQDAVLHLWAGLGYYTRARNLHRCAQVVVQQYAGQMPVDNLQALASLPGIGPSTAAAIQAFTTGKRAVILDGNVKRVIARHAAIAGYSGQTQVNRQLWQKADEYTPAQRLADYTQAIMDLGALVCTRSKPACPTCPVASDCQAYMQQRTDELPSPRPRKTLPQRQSWFLLLHNPAGQLLLHKRPDQGIWGGLWSLPEFTSHEALLQWLVQHYPDAPVPVARAHLLHRFTHFSLILQPLHTRTQQSEQPDPATTIWYDARTDRLGLPQPIQRLIQQLDEPDQGALL